MNFGENFFPYMVSREVCAARKVWITKDLNN